MAKHRERRATKKPKRKELIPGVPSFEHGGGILDLVTGGTSGAIDQHTAVTNPQAFGAIQGTGATSSFEQTLLDAGWLPLPGQPGVYGNAEGQIFDTNPLSSGGGGGGGGGSATPQFRPGELELLQAQSQREQQQLELNQLQEQHSFQIANGQLELARQTEARIAAMQERQFALDQFIQQAQLQLDAQLGGAQGLAGIGTSVGNQSVQRQQFLSNLAANPRDFEQLQIALGGGSSFLDAISQGQRPEGQGINRAQENLPLGQGFLDLLSAVTARPEDAFFNEAAEGFRNIQPITPQTFAHGGKMVTDEPIVGIGMTSGRPRFTLGEPTAQFPQGAPEELDITPLSFAHGGKIGINPPTGGGETRIQPGFQNPFPRPGGAAGQIGINPPVTQPGAGLNTAIPLTRGPGGGTDPFRSGDGTLGIGPLPTGGPLTAPPSTPFVPQAPLPPQTIAEAVANFQQTGLQPGGGNIIEIEKAALAAEQAGAGAAPAPPPLTPGQQVAQMMSAFQPIDFFSMLPSARAILESKISALGFSPEDTFAEFLRNLPTGSNPNAISFGSFSGGGSIATRVA